VLAWALQRCLTLWLQHARQRLQRSGRSGALSLMMLGERLSKVLIIVLAILLILAIAGVDIKTALAGLGIVGLAVALGAQKTVENILGGVLLLGDEAIAIGDFCRISDRLGTVEDITLRSVRIRTVEQTLLSIPAGVLAQAHIENFSSRGKILLQSKLRLAHDTSPAQLRAIRQGIEDLLARETLVDTESSRIRLVDFGLQGVEMELFAYLLTSDAARFLAIREELLLQAAAVVEDAGASFARLWAENKPVASAEKS
jgi:MscS family membrane protein